MLDPRLALAADMYPVCRRGADIGTDHGLLPCHLLATGKCERMLLADISPDALSNARSQVLRQGLSDRAELVCADGLNGLTEPADCVSITGMGGRMVARILREGRERLHGAVLVLSAHTDLPQVREALLDIGYHIAREEVCLAAGRYYILWQAEAGAVSMTDDDIALGTPRLTAQDPAVLTGFLGKQIRVLEQKLAGLRSAAVPDPAAIALCEHQINVLKGRAAL